MTIISTPISLTPDYRALASPVGILDKIKQAGAFKEGTSGADTIPELKAFGDRILYVTGKVGFNAFSNTLLDGVLAERAIRNVLVAGMVTSLCIDSTGRAAYERGFSVTILSDCSSARRLGSTNFIARTSFLSMGGPATAGRCLRKLPRRQRKAVPEFTCPLEGGEKWHFLKVNATLQ